MKIKISGKMKKLAYKSGTLLITALLLFTFSVAAQEEVTRDFHKEYKAVRDTKLDLNNRYGDVIVQTSESDQVVVDVKVVVKYPGKERAEQLLSYIDVEYNESANLIEVKTVFNEKFKFSGWSGESRRFSIDYNVRMPLWMDLGISNRYGNTELDDLSGLVQLDIKYGNLTATKFFRGNEKPMNTLSLAYGKGTIEEAGWLDAMVRYSGNFTVEKSQALLLDSRYSKLQLGTTSSVVGETKYDNLRIENINNLVLDAGYADIYIGTLSKKLVFEGDYGSFNIDRIPSGFESLQTDTRYMGVGLGIEEGASYNLEGITRYGSLKFDDENFQHRRRIIENNSSEISGIVGKNETPSSTVKVTSSYGTVRLY